MSEPITQTATFSQAARQNVADALTELADIGRLDYTTLDEIVPRLLPEAYADIQPWYNGPVPAGAAEVCTSALRTLAAEDRLALAQSHQARAFLGILGIRAA